jgi:hypothetical protein
MACAIFGEFAGHLDLEIIQIYSNDFEWHSGGYGFRIIDISSVGRGD